MPYKNDNLKPPRNFGNRKTLFSNITLKFKAVFVYLFHLKFKYGLRFKFVRECSYEMNANEKNLQNI